MSPAFNQIFPLSTEQAVKGCERMALSLSHDVVRSLFCEGFDPGCILLAGKDLVARKGQIQDRHLAILSPAHDGSTLSQSLRSGYTPNADASVIRIPHLRLVLYLPYNRSLKVRQDGGHLFRFSPEGYWLPTLDSQNHLSEYKAEEQANETWAVSLRLQGQQMTWTFVSESPRHQSPLQIYQNQLSKCFPSTPRGVSP